MGEQARSHQASPDPGMRRILEALRRFSAGHLDHKVEVAPGSPLAPLADELNQMADRLLRRREEMVRAVELYCLHKFGSSLVHDLKNLAARLGFIPENLRGDPRDPEAIEACAATIEDTVERLQSLIRRFREQREATVLKAPADINDVARAALEQSGARAASDIRTEMLLGDLPRTCLDAPYVEEALVNILRNAVEAMKGTGRLTVRTALQRDPAGRPVAVVSISDEGPGMSAQFIERELFTPFHSTKERGMGLGMFSCRETVELHGGTIEVDSEPGRGTTFHVHLPIVALEDAEE